MIILQRTVSPIQIPLVLPFYNDFIIKSKRYKKLKCLCFHLEKFSFPIVRSLDAHASICTLNSFICSRIKYVNLYTLHLFNYMN